MKTKRVLIVAPEEYPKVKVGGLGRMVAGVHAGLVELGVEVKVVSPNQSIYGQVAEYKKLGWRAGWESRRWQPDWVWSHDWGGVWAGQVIKKINPEIKILWTVHSPIECSSYGYGYGYSGNEEKIDWGDSFFDFGAMVKEGVSLATKTSTVSKSFARRLTRHEWFSTAGQIAAVGNGIDIREWAMVETKEVKKRELQQKMGLPVSDVPVFCFVSRVTKQKGVERLVKVMEKVIREKEMQFVVVGNGEKRLGKMIKQLEEKYPLKVATKLEADFELPKLVFAGSDFLVLPSIEEPFGIVVAEARARGVIPIVTGVDGLKDQVQDGKNGLVVTKSLREKIEEAVEIWGSDKAKKWSMTGISLVEDWKQVSKKWLEVLG